MANEIRNEELAPADIEILGWRIMHGEATSFEREVAGKIILDAAAKRREPAPLSERAEPKERLARITVRNPNLMRAITVEICGKETKLNAGESVDLALAEITNLRRDMERGMANHNADLNTAGSSRPFITRLALENGGMVDVDLSDGTNLPFTEWTKFTTWLMDRDGTPASRSHETATQVREARPSIGSTEQPESTTADREPASLPPSTAATPKTDAIMAGPDYDAMENRGVREQKLVDLSRQLERELAVANTLVGTLKVENIKLGWKPSSTAPIDEKVIFEGWHKWLELRGANPDRLERLFARDAFYAGFYEASRSAIEKQRDAIIERCAVVCEQTHSGDAVRAERRTCTCHPDERPTPCQQKFALNDCRAAAALSKPGDGGRA